MIFLIGLASFCLAMAISYSDGYKAKGESYYAAVVLCICGVSAMGASVIWKLGQLCIGYLP